MKLYNTKTHNVEKFVPWNENVVNMYTCGPTVYSYAHIGNLRSYIMEDVLEKTLNYLGYNVKRAMNITDVGHLSSDADTGDDKMVKSAKKENKTVLDIAKFYTDVFFEDCKKLNIKKPEIVSAATDNINEYIKIISNLLEKGYAYQSGGNVYFDTSKLENYYALTNHKEEELISGVRESVEEDKNKKNKADFVLWFTKSKFEDQELKWDSPWGYGYPGWHIECTGISLKYLGEQLDIHCGGIDNIFPHHTNEIAQSEAFIGHPWCKHWFHVEYLNDKNGKMSKSKGDTLTVATLEKNGINPISYRLFCLGSHYRNTLEFSYDSVLTAQNTYEKLLNKVKNIKENCNDIYNKEDFDKYNNEFKKALENDLNTSSALTVLYDVIKSDISNNTKIKLIDSFDKVLSLDLLKEKEINDELKKYIEEKIEERKNAKKNKDYEKADMIREELLSKGIEIKDTREGTTYSLK